MVGRMISPERGYMRYLIVVFLSGCTLVEIDYNTRPPADWPNLEEKIHHVEIGDLPKFCGPKPTLGHAEGCSVVHFGYEVCYIYLATKDPAVLEHERAHCKGYSHVGEGDRAHKAWERWKATKR